MINIIHKILANKDLMILAGGRIIQIILSFLAIRIITSIFTLEEVGNYYLFISIGFLFSLIIFNPIAMYFSRHLIDWKSEGVVLYAYTLFCIIVLFGAIFSILVSSILFYLFEYHTKFGYIEYTLAIFAISFLSVIHRNTLTAINILNSRIRFILYNVITLSIGVLLAATYTLFIEAKAVFWFFGILTAELITFLFIVNYFIGPYNMDKERWHLNRFFKLKTLSNFSIPISITNIFIWSQMYLYRIIIDDQYGAEMLGVLGVVFAISGAIYAAFENVISQYFYPIYLKGIHNAKLNERGKTWNDMANRVIPVYLLLLIFVVCLSKNLAELLVDSKFHFAYPLIMIAAGCEFLRVMTNLFNYVLQAEYKTNLAIAPYFYSATFLIASLLSLNLENNLAAIAWIVLLSNFIAFIFVYYQVSKLIKISLTFNYKKIVVLFTPFVMYKLMPTIDMNFVSNFLTLLIFGLYLIFAIYYLYSLKEKSS